MQRACVMLESMTINVELPEAEAEVVPGVPWGAVGAFPTPAYWAYQVMARRIEARSVRYKLGKTLREEVGACLLGGHGIPASIGLLAYQHLKAKGAFEAEPPDEQVLFRWLSEPMLHQGRLLRYRFANQKARYLAAAMRKLAQEAPPSSPAVTCAIGSPPSQGLDTKPPRGSRETGSMQTTWRSSISTFFVPACLQDFWMPNSRLSETI